MSVELNDGKDRQTVEMDEYYDSKNRLAKVVTRFRDNVNKIDLESTQLINAVTNELFIYSGKIKSNNYINYIFRKNIEIF